MAGGREVVLSAEPGVGVHLMTDAGVAQGGAGGCGRCEYPRAGTVSEWSCTDVVEEAGDTSTLCFALCGFALSDLRHCTGSS